MTKSARESFCSLHCVCFEIPLSKKRAEQLNEELKRTKTERRNELRKLKLKMKASVALGYTSKMKTHFHVTLYPIEERGLSDEKFCRPFPILQKTIDILERFSKKFEGTSCTEFAFDFKRFKTVGELIIPTKFTLRPELTQRLGKPELSGLVISFEKSPIGIDNVKLELENGNIMVRVSSNYKLVTINEILTKTFDHSKQIARLFVEEKT